MTMNHQQQLLPYEEIVVGHLQENHPDWTEVRINRLNRWKAFRYGQALLKYNSVVTSLEIYGEDMGSSCDDENHDNNDNKNDEYYVQPLLAVLEGQPQNKDCQVRLKRFALHTMQNLNLVGMLFNAVSLNSSLEKVQLRGVDVPFDALLSLLEGNNQLQTLALQDVRVEGSIVEKRLKKAATSAKFLQNIQLDNMAFVLPDETALFRGLVGGASQTNLKLLDISTSYFGQATKTYLKTLFYNDDDDDDDGNGEENETNIKNQHRNKIETLRVSIGTVYHGVTPDAVADIIASNNPFLRLIQVESYGTDFDIGTMLQPLQIQQQQHCKSTSTSFLKSLQLINFQIPNRMEQLIRCIPTLAGLSKLQITYKDIFPVPTKKEYDSIRTQLLQALQQNPYLQEVTVEPDHDAFADDLKLQMARDQDQTIHNLTTQNQWLQWLV